MSSPGLAPFSPESADRFLNADGLDLWAPPQTFQPKGGTSFRWEELARSSPATRFVNQVHYRFEGIRAEVFDRDYRSTRNGVERAVLSSSELQRLHNIANNASLVFTERGEGFKDTRLVHSYAVGLEARKIADSLGLDDRTSLLVTLAGYLHDVGHPPFAHSGEYAIWTRDRDFDHDIQGLHIIASGNIRKVLLDHGIHPAEIMAILAANAEHGVSQVDIRPILLQHGYPAAEVDRVLSKIEQRGDSELLNFIVKEMADRCTYLRMDFDGSNFSRDVKARVYADIDKLLGSLRLIEGKVFCDDEAAIRILAYRRALYEEYAQHPAAGIVDEMLTHATKQLFGRGFSVDLFKSLTDNEALAQLDPKYVRWLQERVEQSLTPIGSWRLSDILPERLSHLGSKSFRDGLRGILSEVGIDPDMVYVSLVRNYSKKLIINTLKGGSPVTVALSCDVPSDKLKVTIAVSSELSPDLLEKAKETVRSVMRHFLLENRAEDQSSIAFDNINPRLFENDIQDEGSKLVPDRRRVSF